MVNTRSKNKDEHPAAPVMTERAKVKAGIQPPRPKKTQKKDDQIRELKARLAAFERPDEATIISKEPLVR
jgi:hypothetical protein